MVSKYLKQLICVVLIMATFVLFIVKFSMAETLQFEYDGSILPANANPPWEASVTGTQSTDRNILTLNTIYPNGSEAQYLMRNVVVPGSPMALEARVKIGQIGNEGTIADTALIITDTRKAFKLDFLEDRIADNNSSDNYYLMDTKSDYHVYRLEYDSEIVNVFVDGTKVFTIPGFPYPANYISFGEMRSAEGGRNSISYWDYVRVYKLEANRSPVLEMIPQQTVSENSLLSFNLNANDPDGNPLTYTFVDAPLGLIVNPTNGSVTWTPTYEQAGIYNVTFTASDGILTDTKIANIVVNNTNRAPVIDAIPDITTSENSLVSFNLNAIDPDGDLLTYSSSNAPLGLTVNPLTGSVIWTPDYDQARIYDISFVASDGSLTDTKVVRITVNNINRMPVLNTIGDKTVDEGANLTFSLSGIDPDGDSLTYSATNLPQGAIFDPIAKTFSWTPNYDQAGAYQGITFEVSDGNLSDTETITINVNNVNRAPVASIQSSYVANEGETVIFDASSSADPDGDTLQYRWDFNGDGTYDTDYSSSSTASYAWNDDYAGNVIVEVSDSNITNTASASIIVNNLPPIANAGPDKTVDKGSTVYFNGSATDIIEDTFSYEWDFGDGITAVGADASHAYNNSGTYTVTLTARDEDNGVGVDTLVVQVINLTPIANAGIDQTNHVGDVVTLDTSSSSDPNGDTITYRWSIVSQPSGSNITLSDSTSVNPTFTSTVKGDYVFELTVTDNEGAQSTPDQVTISSLNSAPFADAGFDQLITLIGSQVNLDGSQSYDVDGDLLTYSWQFVTVPDGSSVTITNADTATPSFVADRHGDYVLQLSVSDPWGEISTDMVLVGFENIKPVADAGTSKLITVGDSAFLDGVGSFDANGDYLSYSWSTISAPQGSNPVLLNPTSMATSFLPDAPGTYVLQLVVNDGIVDSDPSTIQVEVITKQSSAINAAQELARQIAALDPSAFKNANMQNALLNKINAVVANIEAGNYQDALDQTQNDIFKKTDGVATIGQIDKNDWITDVESQNIIYPYVIDLINKLKALI